MPETYYKLLDQLVTEFTDHGYLSIEQLEGWQRRIREAAQAQFIPERQLEEELREAFTRIYTKVVEQGGALRNHPGIERLAFERLKPTLRNEVTRRAMAANELVRLNRNQLMDQSMKKLVGWATAIPPGGSARNDKLRQKAAIKAPLKAIPSTDRAIVIDQGHKLTSTLHDLIAEDGGAIAVIWNSRWRQPGYNYRPDHKERDELIYLLRGSWADVAGLVTPVSGYYDDITAFGEEPNCRCYGTYLYSLSQLPAMMLSARGRDALRNVGPKADAIS
jgi:hypothetical protein